MVPSQTWLDVVRALARSQPGRAPRATRSAWQELCLARAKSTLALAEFLIELASPRREFSYEVVDVLRGCCRWLLAYDSEGPDAPERLPEGVPESLRLLLRRSLFEDASLPAEQAESDRDDLLSFAKQLFALREQPEREIADARRAARLRVLARLLPAAMVLGAVVLLVCNRDSLRPNLASGRPWTASSTLAVCDPAHATCADSTTEIFFHTKDEESPWIEFDLGARKWFRRVEVQNRMDCCQERATPLVIEVSDDGIDWVEVIRKDTDFSRWTAEFPKRQARYVRLRVARKSMLHLQDVAIR